MGKNSIGVKKSHFFSLSVVQFLPYLSNKLNISSIKTCL